MDRFALALSPSGRVRLEPSAPDAVAVAPPAAKRIVAAFERGFAHGVLHLGAAELETPLAPSAAWFRELAKRLVTTLCATPEGNEHELPPLEIGDETLDELVASAPPFVGSELLTRDVVRNLWRELDSALRVEIAEASGSVRGWLAQQHPLWHRVGRIVLHLAENKRDTALPFAFLATYTTHLSRQGAVQYVPLGRAVEASADKQDRRALLALLEPLKRASERSELLQRLVASGDVFHPLAWDPQQAYAFLQQIPLLEESGVSVRVPDWWSQRRPPRPKVKVTIGGKKPAGLGAESLVAFDVTVTLDGEQLGAEDWTRALQGTSGLSLIRGRWVEIDRERLEATLAHWQNAQSSARAGVPFHEAMRLLTRAEATPEADPDDEGWSSVEAGAWFGKTLDRLQTPEHIETVEPGAELRATLRPYQKLGVRWLWLLHELGLGGCLADDMGLGKTLQVIGLLVLRKERALPVNALLVVPASLLANWKSELERFAPSLSAVFAHPSQRSHGDEPLPQAADRADIVLTTYGMVSRQPWLRERAWAVVVLDEAQIIKNPAANQTRSVKQLSASFRLVLTGTPVENRLSDLWSIFDFACPGLLGSAKEFRVLAKRLEQTEHADFSPLRRLIRPYLLRRLKTDKSVIADLPDKTEVVAYCSLTKAQAALYQTAVDELARDLAAAEGMKRRGLILATILRMKQICNHPAHWLRHGDWDEAASGKLQRLRELCEPIAARQERVLVFTQFREATAPLALFLARLFGRQGLVLHGGTSVGKRMELVRAFEGPDGPPFFVLSLKAGGTGLNLTAASHVVHFDRWWNPAVEAQATDRAFRIGQQKNVLVHKLVCRGTVEEQVDRLIESKRALQHGVLSGGGEAILTELPNDEILRLVALDLSSALGDAA
jgi:SNF2-related domain/SNF2 Helicase protein/Helicase conserved C-terminal domain